MAAVCILATARVAFHTTQTYKNKHIQIQIHKHVHIQTQETHLKIGESAGALCILATARVAFLASNTLDPSAATQRLMHRKHTTQYSEHATEVNHSETH